MRTLTLQLSDLGLALEDEVMFRLVDVSGNPCTSPTGYALDETIAIDADPFQYDLMESDKLGMCAYYSLTIPSGAKFLFLLPSADEETPHDMLALIEMGCFSAFIDPETGAPSDLFLEQLNLFFAGEKHYFTRAQEAAIRMYVYYADEVMDSESTIDVMQMLDAFIGSVGVENG